MVSLLDIVPSTKHVPVNGQQVEVKGLGLADIAYLIGQYPEVKKLFTGGGGGVKFSVEDIIEKAPGVAYDIIVCGTGNRGSHKARTVVESLAVDAQFDLLKAIVDESFKSAGGPGPFVERVVSLFGESAAGITALASNSPKPQKR